MEKCELDNEKVPNFNKAFYYNQKEDQICLQTCYNTRMDAHFGHEEAEKRDLHLDFTAMKREYQNYEQWYPAKRHEDKYERGYEDTKIKSMMDNLREKSMNRGNKFNFQ